MKHEFDNEEQKNFIKQANKRLIFIYFSVEPFIEKRDQERH